MESKMRLGIFIDLSYLRQCDEWQVDMRKLPSLIKSVIEEKTNTSLDVTKVVAVGSIPTNCSNEDTISGFNVFFDTLRTMDLFEVIALPIDYKGFRLNKSARQLSSNQQERDFIPHEKGVDTSVVTRILELYYRDKAMDVCCVVSGDQDMLPAILSIRNSGCIVYAAGVNIRQTMGMQFMRENIQRIDLQDYRDELDRNVKIASKSKPVENPLAALTDLTNEIKNSLVLLEEWDVEKLRLKMNIWACTWRKLVEQIDDPKNDELRTLFQMLFQISGEYRPGSVPALKKTFIGDWDNMISSFEQELLQLSAV